MAIEVKLFVSDAASATDDFERAVLLCHELLPEEHFIRLIDLSLQPSVRDSEQITCTPSIRLPKRPDDDRIADLLNRRMRMAINEHQGVGL